MAARKNIKTTGRTPQWHSSLLSILFYCYPFCHFFPPHSTLFPYWCQIIFKSFELPSQALSIYLLLVVFLFVVFFPDFPRLLVVFFPVLLPVLLLLLVVFLPVVFIFFLAAIFFITPFQILFPLLPPFFPLTTFPLISLPSSLNALTLPFD